MPARNRRPWPALSGPFCVQYTLPASTSIATPTHHFAGSGPGRGSPLLASTRVSMSEPSRLARIRRMPSRSPVQLSALLFELQLLGSECAALGNDRLAILPVEVSSLDGAVVGNGVSHVGPVDVSRRDIDRDAIRVSALGDEDLAISAIRTQRDHAVVA